MHKLIYVLIMAVAGSIGWYAGSWQGRDAVQAVARYRQLADEADRALQQAEARLKADLAARDAQLDAQLRRLGDAHAAQIQAYDAQVAGNADQIARLTRDRATQRARIVALSRQQASAPTPQAQAQVPIAAEIRAAVAVVRADDAEIAGRGCLSTAVPAAVLAAWQAVQP